MNTENNGTHHTPSFRHTQPADAPSPQERVTKIELDARGARAKPGIARFTAKFGDLARVSRF